MKALVRELLVVLGAQVTESPPHELHVEVPEHAPAGCILPAPSEHRLSFSLQNENPAALAVAPGSALLEKAATELAQIGGVRHGLLPACYPACAKDLKARYGTFGDGETKFSCRRGWSARVRLWLKVKFAGDEVIETLDGIEIPAGRQPHHIAGIPSAENGIRWIEKPPLTLNRLKQAIDTGLRFAENSIIEKAAVMQKENLKKCYPALERLRTYYHQLAADTPAGDGQQTEIIRAEYRRRLMEEVERATVTATAELVALETLSTPVQNLKWRLRRNGNPKVIRAVLSLHDGRFESNARGEICGQISCLNPIKKGRCWTCRTQHSQLNLF